MLANKATLKIGFMPTQYFSNSLINYVYRKKEMIVFLLISEDQNQKKKNLTTRPSRCGNKNAINQLMAENHDP